MASLAHVHPRLPADEMDCWTVFTTNLPPETLATNRHLDNSRFRNSIQHSVLLLRHMELPADTIRVDAIQSSAPDRWSLQCHYFCDSYHVHCSCTEYNCRLGAACPSCHFGVAGENRATSENISHSIALPQFSVWLSPRRNVDNLNSKLCLKTSLT